MMVRPILNKSSLFNLFRSSVLVPFADYRVISFVMSLMIFFIDLKVLLVRSDPFYLRLMRT